jgi:ABC-type phosphate transport system permease subunit
MLVVMEVVVRRDFRRRLQVVVNLINSNPTVFITYWAVCFIIPVPLLLCQTRSFSQSHLKGVARVVRATKVETVGVLLAVSSHDDARNPNQPLVAIVHVISLIFIMRL